jgi:predicted DNA-binding transcriptional regulator AlpA
MIATTSETHRQVLGRFLKPTEVMQALGYSDRTSFWQFVARNGVPHIRLNQRRILFERDALEAWLASRTVGGNARRSAFASRTWST